MTRQSVFWGVVVVLLVLLAYTIPYTLLRSISAWYGSFLFWAVIGALIIFANVMITKAWGDHDES
ncbi:hypothetical protein [Tuberibacillus sp. Marseille-P3662]|uniref:hypothetical protein n=1 Tax=Tuberibacillus sp. Marseille-P3662 TaxID=1965358 RepID=UPI000A1CC463|nr:hypothetical protein [Tuberibacillus sp. Marseille-P3662]